MAKVTVYVDDEIWAKFRASVMEKHGSLKLLDKEVEQSLTQILKEGELLTHLARLGGTAGQKQRDRPRLRGPPAEQNVRQMRRARFESLSGH